MKDILVCIPTYNDHASIEATLRSIVAQTSTQFHILVVDNKSTDQTVAIAKRIQREWGNERFRIHENDTNLGRIGNWNQCLQLFLRGEYEYLKFVFAGDTLKPRALEILQNAFEKEKKIGLVAAAYDVQHAEKRDTMRSFPRFCVFEPRAALREFFLKGNWVGAMISCMVSRTAVKGVRFSESFVWAADWKFFMHVAFRSRSAYMPESLGVFNITSRKHYLGHQGSFSAKLEDAKMRGYALYLWMRSKVSWLSAFLAFLRMFKGKFFPWLLFSGKGKYVYMQRVFYEHQAARSSYEQGNLQDWIVGSYEAHNTWTDYDKFLLRDAENSWRSKTALDFGCGPGRNIVLYHGRFGRLDGVDISEHNISNAKKNLAAHGVSNARLYVNNGMDLASIGSGEYDLIISTITMQHICVHEIRFGLFEEFFRVLKEGGSISVQMGYGKDAPRSVPYEANHYWALSTNRGCDTRVESPRQLQKDLVAIGFRNFEYWIRPTGPGDTHPNWIFFTATK